MHSTGSPPPVTATPLPNTGKTQGSGRVRTSSGRRRADAELRNLAASLEARVNERTKALEQQAAVLTEQAVLLDLVPNAVIVRDMDNRIVFWSHGAEAMYGWRNDEVLGKDKRELLHEQFPEPFHAIEAKLLKDGRWDGEVVHRSRDGRELMVNAKWALQRDLDDRPLRILSICRDITERKAADAALQRTIAELKRSNEELAAFANIASHDLQEPLRMVASYTELLARRYKGKLDADADEFIAFAVDGATRMQRLIRDLLAYSKVGNQGLAPTRVSAEKALEQALKNLKGAIDEAHAEVTHDPLPDLLAEEIQLVQLFQNLVGNAIKYQKPGNVPKVRVSVGETGNGLYRFSVADNGIGIEPQYFDRIFGMFQRLHKRNEYAGTGIGLTMCKKIVELHGGEIKVESEPGAGSTFTFTWLGGSAA